MGMWQEINGMPRTVPVPEKKLSPKTAPSSQRDAKLIGSSGSFEIKSRRKEKSGLADSQKRFSNEWREELGKEVPKTPICMVDEIFSKVRVLVGNGFD